MPARVAEIGVAESGLRMHSSRAAVRAFTLIDILVTIAVIGVLIAIMLPSIASVKETAHQVVCRSNIRQMAFAVDMYAEGNKNYIPSTLTISNMQDFTNETSYNTLTLRFVPDGGYTQITAPRWDGLGLLFDAEYLPVPKIFYCPSHRGENPYNRCIEQWRSVDQAVVGNFQYRGRGPTIVNGTNRMSNRLDLIRPSAALVADGLRTQADFNHLVGANILRADLSVDWFQDSARTMIESLPKDGQSVSSSSIQSAWTTFDQADIR